MVRVADYGEYEILGRTRDDAAGEAFDKVARLLGLPYPGGAKIDKLSYGGNKNAIDFPLAHVNDSPYDFSFSGLKTSAINYIHTNAQKGLEINSADVAACFTNAVVKTILSRVELLFDNGKLLSNKLVLAGGVSANSHIRSALETMCRTKNIRLFVPPLSLCGDNAAMIGAQGYFEYLNAGKSAPFNLNAYATMGVDEV